MTIIRVYEENGVYTVEMNGHAGYNPGNDVVCSAISTLIQTYAASAENKIGGASLVSAELDYGRAKVSTKGCKALYRSCVLGLMMIEKAYPDYVKIKNK